MVRKHKHTFTTVVRDLHDDTLALVLPDGRLEHVDGMDIREVGYTIKRWFRSPWLGAAKLRGYSFREDCNEDWHPVVATITVTIYNSDMTKDTRRFLEASL